MKGRRILRKYNIVHSPYKRIVKSTRYLKPRYTARTLFKSLPSETLNEVLSRVKHECELLCKVMPAKSVLRSGSVNELKKMEWGLVLDELKKRAPVLLSILMEAATSGSGAPSPSIISMAAAILLKARSKNVCTSGDGWCPALHRPCI